MTDFLAFVVRYNAHMKPKSVAYVKKVGKKCKEITYKGVLKIREMAQLSSSLVRHKHNAV